MRNAGERFGCDHLVSLRVSRGGDWVYIHRRVVASIGPELGRWYVQKRHNFRHSPRPVVRLGGELEARLVSQTARRRPIAIAKQIVNCPREILFLPCGIRLISNRAPGKHR